MIKKYLKGIYAIGDSDGTLSENGGGRLILPVDESLRENGGRRAVLLADATLRKNGGRRLRVFHYEDDGRGRIKREIIQRIGRSWRNARNHLFHKVYDKELTFEENLKCKLAGIEEKCRKNAINRSKQLYTHTRGSKTMARKRHEEGRPISRGEEAIEHIESQDPSSKEFSQNDSLAQVLEKEHPGRVRGLGFGPCPSQCFRNIPQQSDYCVQIEEYQMEIVKLKAEVAVAEEKAKRQRMEAKAAEEKAKMQTIRNLLRYIIQQQGGNLPPEIAADLDSLRSAPTSSHAR
ncbi:uncharacterized protein LOC110269338 [Arachis ipaensis]|uniref:uncharacterized protein LOC110269338 n=1 Tax=Arachis ipaensis TaxID=130454 RepID=UPI000A2B202B|nr:uncharacterized protein LOC110269338 [Arachis ipaensis]